MSGTSGWFVRYDRYGVIYTKIYLQYLQRCTHSRYICIYSKVDRSLQHVFPRRQQWNVLPTVWSISRSAHPPTVTWPPSQFQDHIWCEESICHAVKWCSRDVQVIRHNEAWRFMVMTDVNLQETTKLVQSTAPNMPGPSGWFIRYRLCSRSATKTYSWLIHILDLYNLCNSLTHTLHFAT